MARLGVFDPHLEPLAWFDAQILPEGWFSEELIGAPPPPPPPASANLDVPIRLRSLTESWRIG